MLYLGPSYQYKATIDRVIDGDTYAVTVDLGFNIKHSIHVRLHNFDTPELRSKNAEERVHAQAAKEFVTKLFPTGTPVVLSTVKAAAYNRWEADVWYMSSPTTQLSLARTLEGYGFAKKASYPDA